MLIVFTERGVTETQEAVIDATTTININFGMFIITVSAKIELGLDHHFGQGGHATPLPHR